MQVTVLTHISSPYQVEFFDLIGADQRTDLRVIYAEYSSTNRQWSRPSISHHHCFLDQDPKTAIQWIREAELSVFGWYGDSRSRSLIRERSGSGAPWSFWGERPRLSLGWLSRFRRRILLRDLHRSNSPIWGIGEFGIEGWKREFGLERKYFNLPYFSNLARFSRSVGKRVTPEIRFLYSGSLIHRKGVDLISKAFLKLAKTRSDIKLAIMGSGELEAQMRAELAPLVGQVEFLGFKDWYDLPSVYHSCSMLLAPSRYDGWGLIIPEGLAAGLPVICSDRMGAGRDLITQDNGWIVKSGSLESLYQAMSAAIQLNAAQQLQMSQAAESSVANHQLVDGAERFVAACRSSLLV